MPLTLQQLNLLDATLKDAIALAQRLGHDGEKIKAFYEDFSDALRGAKDIDEQLALVNMVLMLGLLAQKAVTGARRNIFSMFGDPLKEFRWKADDYARAFNFKRYRALRNI